MTNDDALALFMFFALLIGGAIGYYLEGRKAEK